MKRKTSPIFQIFLAIIILLSSCSLPGAQTSTPEASASIQSPAPSAIEVIISAPAGGSTWNALAPVPVTVELNGEAQTVDLLVDGKNYQDGKEPNFSLAKWEWISSTPGMHTLQAQVKDNSDGIFTSRAVTVWISDTAARSATLYMPQDGDTVNGLAERLNTTPELIRQSNPFLPVDFSAPIPLDRPLKILNLYPSDFSTQFPGFDFPDSKNTKTSEISSPQTQFNPNAEPPFNKPDPFSPEVKFVDRSYYYISLDGSPWSRVPRNQGEFLTPKNGFFDLDEVLGPLLESAPSKDIHVVIDAWGWQGGTLVYVGRFERTITADTNNEPWAILPGLLEICEAGTNCSQGEVSGRFAQYVTSQGGNHTLRWQAPPGVNDGLWQTSTQPFRNSCELEPAYLYTAGHVGSAGKNSTFTVQFPPYYGEDMTFYVRVLPIVNGQPDCTPSNTAILSLAEAQNIILPTPMLPPPPPVAYDIEITDFKPIHFPDYDYRYCVTITENPYYDPQWDYDPFNLNAADLIKSQWYKTPLGANICPAAYVYEEPSFLDQALDVLKQAVDLVADIYNGLKKILVTLVAKLNPICLQASLINEAAGTDAQGDIEAVCEAGAQLAVNIGLAYLGLPPSLPNYDELMDVAKGQATALIAQKFEETTGIPCSDEEIIPGEPSCKELIRKALDTIEEEAKSRLSEAACMDEVSAHDNGIEPLCLPDEVKAVPMHEGQLEPAVATIQLTRKSDAPDSAFPDPQLYDTSCTVQVDSFAENGSWAGQQVFLGTEYSSGELLYWQGAPVSGEIFKKQNVAAPILAPGESTTLTFALEPRRGIFPPGGDGFWLPGRMEIYAAHYYGSQLQNYYGGAYDDWEYLYFGSTATVNATAKCSTSFATPPAGAGSYNNISSSSASDEWIAEIPQQGQ